jgi:hypothetical protein
MAKNSPTESEILADMDATGGDDYFAVEARLQRRLNEAERAAEKLLPLAKGDNAEPWPTEPSSEAIHEKMQIYGLTFEDARAEVKAELVADAKRLAAFAPESATEISEALAIAEAARERVENLLADHEAQLSSLTGQIFTLGKIRRKIAVVKSLALDDVGAAQIAQSAISYFVERHVRGATTQNVTGFRSSVEDLAFRKVLTEHVSVFTAPLESQAVEIIKEIRSEAKICKIDLRKVLELLAAQRGKSGGEALEMDSNFYSGLV